MAVEQISYAAKHAGDLFTSTNANEIKEVVNNNAEILGGVQTQVNTMNGTVSEHTTKLNALTGRTAVVYQTNQAASILPNRLNIWQAAVTSLNITMTAGAAGEQNEYMLEFTVSGDTFQLTLSDSVRWLEDPEWEAGYTYQVSILGGLAIVAGWEAAQS